MNISYDQPHKTIVDKIPAGAFRTALFVLWVCSMVYVVAVFVFDRNETTAAVAFGLTLAVAFSLVSYHATRLFPWKWFVPMFLMPAGFLLFVGAKLPGIFMMLGIFGSLAGVVAWLMKGSFEFRKKMSEEIRVRKRVDSLWGLARSGIADDVIRGMSTRRRRLYLVARSVAMLTANGGFILFIVIQQLLPERVSVDNVGVSGLLLIMLAVYLPLVLVVPSWSTLTSILAAELIEKQTLQGELQAAREAQASLLPSTDPQVAGFDISGVCRPASEVGGDFYDYVWLDTKKTKLGIAVADVSGKAMNAAMTAVLTSGMFYSEVQKSSSPREILRRINHPLYLRSDKRTFTALAFAVVNVKTKALTYSCAGQTPPVFVRNGKAQELRVKGLRLPLGVKDDLEYTELKLQLKKNDLLVFHTDGLVEAMNEAKEMFGLERLQKCLIEWHGLSAAAIRDRIVQEVEIHVRGAAQHDDMTLVVVKVV